ncbi:MAG: phytoene/squalene synthase family protein [Gammaproteobacteria bacterium]
MKISTDELTLTQAMLKHYAKSFAWASWFLSKEKYNDIAILYAFCRILDDAVDEAASKEQAAEELYKIRYAISNESTDNFYLQNFITLMHEYSINKSIVYHLIDGVESDIEFKTMTDCNQLIRYAYRVAATVGLMVCDVMNIDSINAKAYAVDLGIAMQLTNIARDVYQDARNDRIYLPQIWLQEKLSASEIVAGNEHIRGICFNTITHILTLAETYYHSSEYGLHYLPMRMRYAVVVASQLYRAIGHKILKLDNNNYWKGRTYVNRWHKIKLTLSAIPHTLKRRKKIEIEHDARLHDPILDLFTIDTSR